MRMILLQITDKLSLLVQNFSDLETNIVAVERIEEYSNVALEVGNSSKLNLVIIFSVLLFIHYTCDVCERMSKIILHEQYKLVHE